MTLLLLLACPGKDAEPADSNGDTQPDETTAECVEDADCGRDHICEDGACVQGDRNNTVDEADPVPWGKSVDGYINPTGDIDWYSIEAVGGEYLRASVTLDIPREEFDTVLTLRDPEGAVVTRADAYATGSNVADVDAVLFAYLERPGTYTFTVEDVGTATGRDPYGDAAYAYSLLVEAWPDVVVESDAAETPGFTADLAEDRVWSSSGFLFESKGDSDWILAPHSRGGTNLYVDGNEDLSGSDADPLVRLWSTDGQLLGEKASFGPAEYLLYPHLDVGDYLVELVDGAGGGGPNHWGFAHLIVREDSVGYEFDEDVEPNESPDEATPLVTNGYKNSDAKPYLQSLGQGTLDTPDDVDVFALTTEFPKGGIVVCLVSSWYGSLVDPVLELVDEEGRVLASDEGDADYPNANLDNTDVTAGTWYVRVRAPLGAETGPGSWYRFTAYAASFSVSPFEEGGYGCP